MQTAPARIVRLTAPQYDAVTRTLTGKDVAPATNPFAHDSKSGRFTGMAADLGMAELVVDQLVTQTEEVAPQVLARHTKPCLQTKPLAKTCVDEVLGSVATAAFRRPVPAAELDPYVVAAMDASTAMDPQLAVQLGVEAILVSPRAVFRHERGGGSPDATGRRRLDAHEHASLLAFALTDAPPDAKLVTDAAAGTLATPQGLRAAIERLSLTPAGRSVFARFVREIFHYDDAINVFKDPKRHPHHQPQALVDDTTAFVLRAFEARRRFVPTLLASPDGFATPETAGSYGVTAAGAGRRALAYPTGQRHGILTHPSFLTATSHGEENAPIARGLLVRERLLCQPMPPIPIGMVPPLPDLGPNATLRERLAVHTQGTCAGCHKLMDPLGLVFEGYDHTGRVRSEEAGKPVDTSGAIVDGPAGNVTLKGPADLANALAAAPQVAGCLLRQAMEFYLARAELPADECAVEDALTAMTSNDGDVITGLTTLLAADVVSHRTREPMP